ncbi:hypothetical protein ACHQM5_028369 [Ranunculus cassubicifolius]
MAYIPPHKRHSKDINTPQPTPSLFIPPSPSQHHRNSTQSFSGKIIYSRDSIHRWFVIPSNQSQGHDHDHHHHQEAKFQLKEFPHELIQRQDGAKPFILLCNAMNESDASFTKSPWVCIEERIRHDLIISIQNARMDMCKDGVELNLPRFIIRFGKVLFHGGPSISLDNVCETNSVESLLSKMKNRYDTNVPDSFIKMLTHETVPKCGLYSMKEKEYYQVKVFDKFRPHSTISCKCTLTASSGELQIYQVELNNVRQLVVDISCLDKNVDLRLLLSSKRILNSLTDEERHGLSSLVKSAVKDSEVKGGLRWPLGKESFGNRFSVVGIWHTKAKYFKSSNFRLKVRDADRFDFRTSTGEVTQEASLEVPKLNKQLGDEALEPGSLVDVVADTLKLVWDNFLSWEGSFFDGQ